MTNERFYEAKERKNDFIVTVEYLQGTMTHTTRKSVLKGKKLLGMKAWDIENPNFLTEEQYNNAVCKSASQRLKTITISKQIYL